MREYFPNGYNINPNNYNINHNGYMIDCLFPILIYNIYGIYVNFANTPPQAGR